MGRDQDRAGGIQAAARRRTSRAGDDRLIEARGNIRELQTDLIGDVADGHESRIRRNEVGPDRKANQADRGPSHRGAHRPVASRNDGASGLIARGVEREPHRRAQAPQEVVVLRRVREAAVGTGPRAQERDASLTRDADRQRRIDAVDRPYRDAAPGVIGAAKRRAEMKLLDRARLGRVADRRVLGSSEDERV